LALYVLAIPVTLVEQLRWWIIPTIILASFILFGIDAIGAQIGTVNVEVDKRNKQTCNDTLFL
jgi:predicted membrane chloride channel (bestrophin family)